MVRHDLALKYALCSYVIYSIMSAMDRFHFFEKQLFRFNNDEEKNKKGNGRL